MYVLLFDSNMCFKEEHIPHDSAPAEGNLYKQGKILKLQQMKSPKNTYLVG